MGGPETGEGERARRCAQIIIMQNHVPPSPAKRMPQRVAGTRSSEEKWRQNGGENMQLSCWGPYHCV